MNEIIVQDETEAHASLAGHLHERLQAAAPYVEKTSGLALPNIHVRLMDVPSAAGRYREFIRGTIERNTSRMQLSPVHTRWARALPIAAERSVLNMWAGCEPLHVANSRARPATFLMPEALAHQGLNEDTYGLDEIVIQTLAIQAQVAACGGRFVPEPGWAPGQPTNSSKLPSTHFSDGHAQWVTRQVLPHLDPPSLQRHPRSGICITHSALLWWGSRRRWTRRAALFVDSAQFAVGMEAVNRVWTDPDLMPSFAELRRPSRWIARLVAPGRRPTRTTS